METLDEWNVELVLVNSHDAGCAYQLHAGIYRRICSSGLVSDGHFQAIRFRHSGVETDEVVQASLRLLEFMPRVGELLNRFRNHTLDVAGAMRFAQHALLLRYPRLAAAPIEPETLLKARRLEDDGTSLWNATNVARRI